MHTVPTEAAGSPEPIPRAKMRPKAEGFGNEGEGDQTRDEAAESAREGIKCKSVWVWKLVMLRWQQ